MARPLREQLAVATLLLLVPLSGVMTWAAGTTYSDQVAQLDREASRLASAIAAHIDQTGSEDPAALREFLQKLRFADGAEVTILDARNQMVAPSHATSDREVEEKARGSAHVPRLDWTVSVGIPTSVAWGRTEPIYRRMIGITAIATLIMLGLEAFFLRRYLGALIHLERSADRVGAGDLSTVPFEPMPSREFEHVRDAFSGMVENLREARESIARQVDEERRIRRELESLQQQLIRQERLAAIGVLLSGIAHELNNPLQAISGFAELLQRQPELGPDVRADLALIKKESGRASAIIRNLSRFSRQQGSQPSAIYLRDVVASVVELRQRRFQEQGIALDVDEQSSQPTLAVMNELQQVLLNFVINAEQALAFATSTDRRIAIRTHDTNAGVALEVEDNGPGVRSEDESKLFQPFFTTKPIGEGTGLGLSVSYGIVRSYGGTIGYRRSDRGGAVFYFELPIAAETHKTA
jgi:C4-dicarboxylate-specific signal transduction histidine kinase